MLVKSKRWWNADKFTKHKKGTHQTRQNLSKSGENFSQEFLEIEHELHFEINQYQEVYSKIKLEFARIKCIHNGSASLAWSLAWYQA